MLNSMSFLMACRFVSSAWRSPLMPCSDKQLPTNHSKCLTGLSDFISPELMSSFLSLHMCSSHSLFISRNGDPVFSIAQAKNQASSALTPLFLSHSTYNLPANLDLFEMFINLITSHYFLCLLSTFKSPLPHSWTLARDF